MIATTITIVLSLASAPIILALLVFCAELIAGMRSQADADGVEEQFPTDQPIRSVVLMPAHNEATVIRASIAATQAGMGAAMQLLVIADNCTDDTACIAREAGAWVVERHEAERRGKGYALAHGLGVLAADPPDCVIAIDADAWPVADALDRLARRAAREQRPVQGSFLIEPDKTLGPVTRFSNFAHMLKNLVRLRGVSRLGRTAFLCGSGMAFPWAAIAQIDLASGEIVEDMVLGVRLAQAGSFPVFDEQSRIRTRSAPGDVETRAQRRRWEHGFIVAAARFAPSLAKIGLIGGRREPLWMALHLMVPPLVLLLGLSFLLSSIALLASLTLGAAPGPAVVLSTLSAGATLLVGLAWFLEGRAYLSLADLIVLPRYLGSKFGIWTGLLRRDKTNWNRTGRE